MSNNMTSPVSNSEQITWVVGSAFFAATCVVKIILEKSRKAYPGVSLDQSVELYVSKLARNIISAGTNLIPTHVRNTLREQGYF